MKYNELPAFRGGRADMIRRMALAMGIAGLAAFAAGASAQEVSKEILGAAKTEGKLTIYGSIETESMQAVQKAFEAKYGIKTEYWRAAPTKVMDGGLTESRAGKPALHVRLTNPTPMAVLTQEGIFA